MKKADITLFTDRASVLLVVPDDVSGKVIKEIIRRQSMTEYDTDTGEITEPSDPIPFVQGSVEYIAYIAVSNGIEQANAKWLERVRKNRASAVKRWNKGTNANACNCIPNDNENENENEKENENENCILDKLSDEEWKEIRAHCRNIRAVTDSISDRVTAPKIRKAYPYFVRVAKGLGYWE